MTKNVTRNLMVRLVIFMVAMSGCMTTKAHKQRIGEIRDTLNTATKQSYGKMWVTLNNLRSELNNELAN